MIFGGLPIKSEEIFHLLREQVEGNAKKISGIPAHMPVHASKPWTKAVFQTLKESLVSRFPFGRAVFTNSEGTATPEFMLDFVWWEQDKTGAERRVIMGAE